jgi:hypothetical protein
VLAGNKNRNVRFVCWAIFLYPEDKSMRSRAADLVIFSGEGGKTECTKGICPFDTFIAWTVHHAWNVALIIFGILLALEACGQADFGTRRSPVLASNANSCASCHTVPIIGGSSNVTVTRLQLDGPFGEPNNSFVLHRVDPQTFVPTKGVRSDRLPISLLGDGYVEIVDNRDIQAARERQRSVTKGKIAGRIVRAPVLEAPNVTSDVGKFGWKGQHSSLYSACADSMLSELGVPNRLYPALSAGRILDDATLDRIVAFVRLLPPPNRDRDLAASEDSIKGEKSFSRIGCSLCHVPTMRTLSAGVMINGGAYRIPEELGDKEFHPYSDFLLHDVGTGDGIIQAATPEFMDPSTASRFRTAPLWGVRYRSWLMHDGKSVTLHQAIMRHGGEASNVVARYEQLTPKERHELDQFLNSL